MAKKDDTCSPIRQGVRSPMNPFEQQMNQRVPSTAGTSEMIRGSSPKAAKINSPTEPKNRGRSN